MLEVGGTAESAEELRLAYLVVTHRMPDHLGRTIQALTDDRTDFFVHVDRKVAIEPFLVHRAPNVQFLERRLPVHWGEWQLVEATLGLMALALGHADYDYLLLLSGSCYPIRSRRAIRALLADRRGGEFINSVAMPSPAVGKTLYRIERFYRRRDQPLMEDVRRLAVALPTCRRSGRFPSRRWLLSRDWRRALGPLAPYGGSTWWGLSREACQYILSYLGSHPELRRFFENTHYPEETLFHTILANSPLGPRIRRSLTYSDWSTHGRHPVEISERHIERFAQPGPLLGGGTYGVGEMCFARKFPDDGGRMTGLVDEMVIRREADAARGGSDADAPVPGLADRRF